MNTGECYFAAIRKADRALTGFYDKVLEPSGLRITAFRLLNNIILLNAPTITALSEGMGLERSTLGRNLKLLERQGLITVNEGEDARSRIVKITKHGERVRNAAIPYWNKAQREIEQMLGEKSDLLHDAVLTLGTVNKKPSPYAK